MNSGKPPDISPEAVIVIPILESISNSVSALPVATPSAQAASVQQSGGLASTFAAIFAAARWLSSEAGAGAGETEEPAAPMAENADAAMTLVMGSAGSTNPPLKKLLNHDVVAANTFAAATQIPPPTQASLLPVPMISTVAFPSGLSQSGSNQSGLSESGSNQSGLSKSGSSKSGSESGSEIAAFATGQGSTDGSLTPPVLSSEAAAGDSGFFEIARGSQNNSSQNGPVLEEPFELAENTPRSSLDSTAHPVISATLVQQPTGNLSNGMQGNELGLDSADETSQTDSVADGSGPGPTLSGPTLSGTALSGSTLSAPVLMAKADSGAGAQAAVQAAFAGTANIGQANSGYDVVSNVVPNVVSNVVSNVVPNFAPNFAPNVVPDTAMQSGVAAQTETENPLAAIFSGQAAPSNLLNPAVPAGSVRAALQFTAAKVGTAVAGVRAGAGARTSILGAALSPASGASGAASVADPAGNQTPFSVFFSGPGPDTESAASALPKLILPPNSAAISGGHGSGANASSVSAQSSGLPNGIPQSGASANAAPLPMKGSLNPTANESLQTAPGSRRDADGNAASAQLAVAQTGAAPAAAPPPPSPAAVTLPLAPAATVSDSLPKPEPPSAPAAPAAAVPVPAETLPAAVPGPVQVAQMINRIGQSEMRIGMNTSAFGSVEVRTVVHANDVGLVIGSEKGDLRTLLASDMPAITNTLQQQNLRLNSVNFMQGFAFSNNASGGGDSRQQSFVPMRTPSSGGLAEATVDDSLEVSAAGEFAGGGLSILA